MFRVLPMILFLILILASISNWIKFTKPANELYFALSGRDADNETISGISVINMSSGNFRAVYRHAIDDLGYFQTGFSPYDVKDLYNDGLAEFLEIMSVSPQDRLTTTWGKLKTQ